MENFANKLETVKKASKTSGGIFDKNKVEIKLKEIEKTLQSENFGKTKF